MPTALITGANRGLGLEFARQYAADGWRVFACVRDPDAASALQEAAGSASPGSMTIHRLDVARQEDIDARAEELGGEAIDVLVNNAGTFGDRRGFGPMDYETWEETFRTNVFGPMRMAVAFADAVARSELKVIANITSKMGSMADNGSGGRYVYRSTKAALNAISVSMAVDLRERGIKVAVLHPGWVATGMGGPSAPLQPEGSVAGMRRVIAEMTAADSGRFLNFDGTEVPW